MGKIVTENLNISGVELNNSDNERLLKFQLYRFKSNGSHKFIGEFHATTAELTQAGKIFQFGATKMFMEVKEGVDATCRSNK